MTERSQGWALRWWAEDKGRTRRDAPRCAGSGALPQDSASTARSSRVRVCQNHVMSLEKHLVVDSNTR
jgi:hypothetical protein